ncbi:MAG: hypothetical protein FWD96_02965, partial [Defluviitaleaceae bacterium]|nr:hypothetical protein [Defluviitaleaceae bacterium]
NNAKADYWNTEEPAWGVKKLMPLFLDKGFKVSCEYLRELHAEMGLETIYPRVNTSPNVLYLTSPQK